MVWRKEWLPASETFIAHHVAGLTRWRPVTVTCRVIDSALWGTPDVALWRRGAAGYAKQALFELHRRSRVVEASLIEQGVSLAHSHFGVDACAIDPLLGRRGIPHVVNFHGYDVAAALQGGSRLARIYRRQLPAMLDRASRIVVPSENMRTRLIDLGAMPSKVRSIPIGVDTSRQLVAAEDRENSVLLVGRLVAKKGVSDLIEAMSRLPADVKDAPVRIVGDGPLRAELTALAKARQVDVSFLGHLAPDQVEEEMRRAAVLCVPSRTPRSGDIEATPMVIKEAGVLGLPTIGSRHGGIPEAITDGADGLLFGEGDVGALRDGLTDLLRSVDLRGDLGAAARATALSRFDAATQVGLLEDLYDELAG